MTTFLVADDEQSMELYPWQSEVCADYDEAACAAFKPMCSIMGVIAHKKCRKTCKLCLQDETSPRSMIQFPESYFKIPMRIKGLKFLQIIESI